MEEALGVATALDRARPEDLAHHRGSLEQALLLRRQAVQPGGDEALERLRQRQRRSRAALSVEPGELLSVERVAAGALEQEQLHVGAEHRALEQVRHQARRLLVGQRLERQRGGVEPAAAPAGAPGEELRPGGADDQQGHARRPVGELVHEVEEAVVGPLQVLEDEHERALRRQLLEEAPPGGEGLAPAVAPQLRFLRQPGQGPKPTLDPGDVLGLDHLGNGAVELLLRYRLPVCLQDAGLGLDDLGQRPEGDAVAVGEAAALAPDDEPGLGVPRSATARGRAGSCRSRAHRPG